MKIAFFKSFSFEGLKLALKQHFRVGALILFLLVTEIGLGFTVFKFWEKAIWGTQAILYHVEKTETFNLPSSPKSLLSSVFWQTINGKSTPSALIYSSEKNQSTPHFWDEEKKSWEVFSVDNSSGMHKEPILQGMATRSDILYEVFPQHLSEKSPFKTEVTALKVVSDAIHKSSTQTPSLNHISDKGNSPNGSSTILCFPYCGAPGYQVTWDGAGWIFTRKEGLFFQLSYLSSNFLATNHHANSLNFLGLEWTDLPRPEKGHFYSPYYWVSAHSLVYPGIVLGANGFVLKLFIQQGVGDAVARSVMPLRSPKPVDLRVSGNAEGHLLVFPEPHQDSESMMPSAAAFILTDLKQLPQAMAMAMRNQAESTSTDSQEKAVDSSSENARASDNNASNIEKSSPKNNQKNHQNKTIAARTTGYEVGMRIEIPKYKSLEELHFHPTQARKLLGLATPENGIRPHAFLLSLGEKKISLETPGVLAYVVLMIFILWQVVLIGLFWQLKLKYL